jgi:hypothetical protein
MLLTLNSHLPPCSFITATVATSVPLPSDTRTPDKTLQPAQSGYPSGGRHRLPGRIGTPIMGQGTIGKTHLKHPREVQQLDVTACQVLAQWVVRALKELD